MTYSVQQGGGRVEISLAQNKKIVKKHHCLFSMYDKIVRHGAERGSLDKNPN